ncbi:MAG: NAD(P)-dependent oxidoreductase [Myxococcales bacterium]|nr:NAD(P)-dependent oxidoreductase [Myxococcales bacterium]
MRALVIGASGFVGRALTERLLADGRTPRVLVRSEAQAETLRAMGAEPFVGELADPNAIARAAMGVERIFHCAGESSPRAAPAALNWIHVAGAENLVAAARQAGVPRTVFVSCADVTLCNRDRLNWSERSALAQNPFDSWVRSKLLGEELALQSSDQNHEFTAVRPPFVWGPGDKNRLPQICAEGLRGGLRLYGSGQNLLATVYIDNLIDALLCAAEHPQVGGLAFHVADSEFHTAAEFFGALCQALGLGPPRRGLYPVAYAAAWLRAALGRSGPWPIDVVRRGRGSLLDCAAAASKLDFTPRVAQQQGMEALSAWVREVGGAAAIASLGRKPADEADVAHFEALAQADG